MNNQRHYIIQFACLIAMLGAIVLQGLTHMVKPKPLLNYLSQPMTYQKQKKELNINTLHDRSYQNHLAEIAWQNTGFREFFSRSYNQLAFSLFDKTYNPYIIKGKHHELHLSGTIEDATGKMLLNRFSSVEAAKAEAKKNVQATLALMDTLRQHDTQFLFVFCPSKPFVYPENLPQRYQDSIADFSLEEYYIQLFKENGIPHIDFHNGFRAIKDTVSYPLFTRLGSHWANSTIPFVADSILRKMEEITAFKLPSVECVNLNLTRDYTAQDGELEPSLNLLFPLYKPKQPRPDCVLSDTLGTHRPNLLVVGDGNFVPFEKSCFLDAFSTWNYWKYNDMVVSSEPRFNWKQIRFLPEASQMLEDADIVMAVYTSNYMYDYMNGFIQTAQELLTNSSDIDQEALIHSTIESIRNNEEWLKAIETQAQERGLTVEENLRLNAIYIIEQQKVNNP
jgi:hypothetical protein